MSWIDYTLPTELRWARLLEVFPFKSFGAE